ncbi:type III-B CRISPR module-associated protein Cmr5 [Paenibacillus sp. GSMTC-2017]|uniref:type III-B CRISPR module-associated protein Cmr5 n=1 Tax=Paenibacillus sp. GSMTC-2017 TaxID=2794350 RepID=UPI0018D6969E|nr:type III-B CRISPR module-associated protein Cmr5 [Paenibacillus sp. GSMTC-2017]MBH5320422.1 type III-B CRISPR module-associated protein Cmr5 [Paenibacillus sp. GSMTC-2017]
MNSLEQQYAVKVLSCMNEVLNNEEKFMVDYGRLCHKFPYMVLTNGLRLTVAFYQGKGKKDKAYSIFIKDLGEVLDLTAWNEMMNKGVGPADYRMLTMRSLKAAAWFKRYAQTILQVDSDDDSTISTPELKDLQAPRATDGGA